MYYDNFGLLAVQSNTRLPLKRNFVFVECDNPELSALKSALQIVNPRTGLPLDILQRYLSDQTPPEVRDFIMRKVLRPVSEGEISTTDLSDDDIARALPNGRESIHDYEQRIIGMLERDYQIEEYERERKRKQESEEN